MAGQFAFEPIKVLLVEDNPDDVELTIEALKDAKVHNELFTVGDGVEAMLFLNKQGQYADMPRPDLILLDLNLPKKDGREVLTEIKADDSLSVIPVVVQAGESVTYFAEAYGTRVETIVRINGLDDSTLIFTEQTLLIPLGWDY